MSLKGYEFYDGDLIQARFFFKDLTLYIYTKISDQRYNEILEYIKKSGNEIHRIEKDIH